MDVFFFEWPKSNLKRTVTRPQLQNEESSRMTWHTPMLFLKCKSKPPKSRFYSITILFGLFCFFKPLLFNKKYLSVIVKTLSHSTCCFSNYIHNKNRDFIWFYFIYKIHEMHKIQSLFSWKHGHLKSPYWFMNTDSDREPNI